MWAQENGKWVGYTTNDKIKSGGSGRSYRMGMSLEDLLQTFPDDETTKAWFADVIWPSGPVCAPDIIPVIMLPYRRTKACRIDAPDVSVTLV